MRTANSNPAATTPEDKMLNAVLGIIGEGGEIAGCGVLSSRFTLNLIDIAIATGEIADAVEKHHYHGHEIDATEMGNTLHELNDALKWTRHWSLESVPTAQHKERQRCSYEHVKRS